MKLTLVHAPFGHRVFSENLRVVDEEFIRGTAPAARLPTPWADLSQAQVERDLRQAYLGFFLRPRMVLKTAAGARSFTEFARYVRVGTRMLIDHTTDID